MDSTAAPTTKFVEVSLTLTDDSGNTQTEAKSVPGGPTPVVELKAELGVPAESALWVINKAGNKHQLADHQNHNVKEGDRYEALVRGGVS
ncbi:MAG TPA: hypothetical protein VM142_10940 [Acidimicrobiales bacterium]|nr:hypothetical protein [Acidimicrobiales bacterium]